MPIYISKKNVKIFKIYQNWRNDVQKITYHVLKIITQKLKPNLAVKVELAGYRGIDRKLICPENFADNIER